MKLLFLIDSLGSGGAQNQMATIAPLLKSKGYIVEVVCYHKDTFFLKKLSDNDIKINWICSNSILGRIIKIRKFIRRDKYDAVISFLEVPDILNCISAIGGHSWKVITSERSSQEDAFKTVKGRINSLLRRFSDLIVCNSENAKNMWLKYYPQYESKLKVVYNTVTLPKINSIYKPFQNGKLNVVVAASYQYLKNPINVIKAINLLDDDLKGRLVLNWYGRIEVIKGDTRAYDESKKLIDLYNLNGIVNLHEPTKDINNIMYEADVVGLFSTLEGLPNVICEAMTLGKPIIMTKVSDYFNIIDNNGVLCDWDDIISISNAFKQLICMPVEDLLIMGEKSKIKSKQLFSEDLILEKWINVIESNEL